MSEKLVPTPKIGTIVLWYDRNIFEAENAKPAVVLQVEAVGKIGVKILRFGDDVHKKGVHHRFHQVHDRRANEATMESGSWEYIGEVIPEEDLKRHKDEIVAKQAMEKANSEAKLKQLARK